jgi:hypothetical protein
MRNLITLFTVLFTIPLLAQDFKTVAKRINTEFNAQVLVPNYKEVTVLKVIPSSNTHTSNLYLNNLNYSETFILSNFKTKQPSIQVIIDLPTPNTDNNVPHYINQLMFKPPQIKTVELK